MIPEAEDVRVFICSHFCSRAACSGRTFVHSAAAIANMTKAEQKKAVQFTRMCKFWRTNECKMGADCTFAHATSELRASPKPCFEFSKTGSCTRGQACRFVHSLDSLKAGKTKDLQEAILAVQHASSIQAQLNMVGAGSMALVPPSLNTSMSQLSNMTSPLMHPDVAPVAYLRPPPGLEDMGMLAGLAPPSMCKSGLDNLKGGDSRRSSLSEVSLGMEGVSLPIPKIASLEQKWAADDATVATQSLTSTACLSTTPSSFSESDTAEGASFWL